MLKFRWVGLVAILTLGAICLSGCASGPSSRPIENERPAEQKNLYWGDLHNHNSIGQIKGSLERTFDIAQSHLDFFAFTPQSQWPDMRQIPGGKNAQFVRGFDAVKANWGKIQQLTAEANRPGRFAAFLGYEVHYNSGDFNIIYPGAEGALVHLATIEQWQAHALETGAILIPHHPAYLPQWRGWDWSRLDPRVSPIVEMMSEHGSAESDRGPLRYIRHSMGGRYTKSTVQWLWTSGVEAGVIASPDDHLGYPGAYGQGLAAVYADSLDRASIMEALKARRTYAVSADRIALKFKVNGHWMGESIRSGFSREISVQVRGEDGIDRVEVLKNNRVIHRDHPVDRQPNDLSWNKPVLLRVEFGWGPWAAFKMPRTADWRFQVHVEGGKLLSVSPHFQSRPFDEQRRNRVSALTSRSCEVASYTSRENALDDKATHDVVLEIEGSPQTEVVLTFSQPNQLTLRGTLEELAESSRIAFLGEFSSESVMMHRVVFEENYATEFSVQDRAEGPGTDWYQVRVVQTNGSLAWSSPVWVAAR